MIVERQTIPHLNALVGGIKILESIHCIDFGNECEFFSGITDFVIFD